MRPVERGQNGSDVLVLTNELRGGEGTRLSSGAVDLRGLSIQHQNLKCTRESLQRDVLGSRSRLVSDTFKEHWWCAARGPHLVREAV